MTRSYEIIESKMDDVNNMIWNIAVHDSKLSDCDVKVLSECYDAKNALKYVYEQMLNKEAMKQCEMERVMDVHKETHTHTHTTTETNTNSKSATPVAHGVKRV